MASHCSFVSTMIYFDRISTIHLSCFILFMFREIIELCAILSERGFTDQTGNRAILFGDIFNAYRCCVLCFVIEENGILGIFA